MLRVSFNYICKVRKKSWLEKGLLCLVVTPHRWQHQAYSYISKKGDIGYDRSALTLAYTQTLNNNLTFYPNSKPFMAMHPKLFTVLLVIHHLPRDLLSKKLSLFGAAPVAAIQRKPATLSVLHNNYLTRVPTI